MYRSSWLHLRIPFSYYLLPVFLFSVASAPDWAWKRVIAVFFVVHLLLYPASNGYNSYFDRDEKSIGGLKHPPSVKRELYYLALTFDVLALAGGLFFVGPVFTVMLFMYGLVSKAYSHPSVRLKKRPLTGWFAAGFFQGFFTFMMCYIGVHGASISEVFHPEILFAASLCSLLLWGSYPMTQVYQHEEDARRGDRTLSLVLGTRGTFIFTALVFTLAIAGFVWFLWATYSFSTALLFVILLLPVSGFFGYWYSKVRHDSGQANFENAMQLNFISATCLNLFFLYLAALG